MISAGKTKMVRKIGTLPVGSVCDPWFNSCDLMGNFYNVNHSASSINYRSKTACCDGSIKLCELLYTVLRCHTACQTDLLTRAHTLLTRLGPGSFPEFPAPSTTLTSPPLHCNSALLLAGRRYTANYRESQILITSRVREEGNKICHWLTINLCAAGG